MRIKKFYFYTFAVTLILGMLNSGCDNNSQVNSSANTSQINPYKVNKSQRQSPQVVTSNQTEVKDKLGLANHLQQIDAKFYGAFWCPYCNRQKQLFGNEAIKKINYIECDPGGENPQPQLCEAAQIEGLPTWEIKGKLYPGFLTLEELAEASDYREDNAS